MLGYVSQRNHLVSVGCGWLRLVDVAAPYLAKLLNAADCGLMHSGTRDVCSCSAMNLCISSETFVCGNMLREGNIELGTRQFVFWKAQYLRLGQLTNKMAAVECSSWLLLPAT